MFCLFFHHQVGLGADKLWLHSDPVSRRNNSVNEEVLWALFYKTYVLYNDTDVRRVFCVCLWVGEYIVSEYYWLLVNYNYLPLFGLVWLVLMFLLSLCLSGGETPECSGFSFEKPQRVYRCSYRLSAAATIVFPAFPPSSANPWCCHWEPSIRFHQQVSHGLCKL